MNILYYSATGSPAQEIIESHRIDSRYRWLVWTPTLCRPLPPGLGWFFLRHCLWQVLRLLPHRKYHVLVIYDGDILAHRSFITLGWSRFPFMGRNDVQVVSSWTYEKYRRQGLATFALSRILAAYQRPDQGVWYVVHAKNAASIRVAEKCGFSLVAKGRRVKRFSLPFRSSFKIDEWIPGTMQRMDRRS